jgi:hypothetical protein
MASTIPQRPSFGKFGVPSSRNRAHFAKLISHSSAHEYHCASICVERGDKS